LPKIIDQARKALTIKPVAVDPEDRPAVAAAREEAGNAGDNQGRKRHPAEASEIGRFDGLQLRRMAGKGDDSRREWCDANPEDAGDDAEPYSLPYRGTNAIGPLGAGVLRDERGHVVGREMEENKGCPEQRDGEQSAADDLGPKFAEE
jgi:hypothetical protein